MWTHPKNYMNSTQIWLFKDNKILCHEAEGPHFWTRSSVDLTLRTPSKCDQSNQLNPQEWPLPKWAADITQTPLWSRTTGRETSFALNAASLSGTGSLMLAQNGGLSRKQRRFCQEHHETYLQPGLSQTRRTDLGLVLQRTPCLRTPASPLSSAPPKDPSQVSTSASFPRATVPTVTGLSWKLSPFWERWQTVSTSHLASWTEQAPSSREFTRWESWRGGLTTPSAQRCSISLVGRSRCPEPSRKWSRCQREAWSRSADASHWSRTRWAWSWRRRPPRTSWQGSLPTSTSPKRFTRLQGCYFLINFDFQHFSKPQVNRLEREGAGPGMWSLPVISGSGLHLHGKLLCCGCQWRGGGRHEVNCTGWLVYWLVRHI